jgi:hypothetical protein
MSREPEPRTSSDLKRDQAAWIKRLLDLCDGMNDAMSTGGDFRIDVSPELVADIHTAAAFCAAKLGFKASAKNGVIVVEAAREDPVGEIMPIYRTSEAP